MRNIVIVTDPRQIRAMLAELADALDTGTRVRIAIEDGVKIAVGGGTWSIGRGDPADRSGQWPARGEVLVERARAAGMFAEDPPPF